MTKLFRSNRRRRGIIAALVAVCLVAVMMIAAIAVDGGRILDARRQSKAVADAAARGAALEMLDMISGDNTSATISSIRATAFRLANDCGFANDGTNSVVTVNTPPTSGAYAGQNGFVEVIIEFKLDRGFSRILGSDPISAVARSVAGGTFVPSKASIVVLDPKADDALKLGGGSSSLTVDGDIAINSSHHGGLKLDDHTSLTADNIWLASSMEKDDYKKVQGSIHGQLRTQVPPTADPYQGLPTPAPGTTRTLSNYKTSQGNGSDTFNLQPGRYTEDWNFDHADIVNLAPGTYYLDNKNIDIHDQSSISGSGVTIYSAGDHDMHFHTTGSIDLTSPTSGTYQGILLMKDPTAHGNLQFEKDSNFNIDGVIYAPGAEVHFQHMDPSQTGNISIAASVVAKKLKIEDNSSLTIQGARVNIQRPFLGLVE